MNKGKVYQNLWYSSNGC